MDKNKHKYLTDEAINLLDDTDLLGTKIYVEQLKNLILTCIDTDYTETIGLIGNWGSGKSSIIKTLQRELEDDVNYNKKIRFVNYNAWKFNKDNFRKQFLINSYEDEQEREKIEKELYTVETVTTIKLNEKIKKWIPKICIAILVAFIVIMVIVCSNHVSIANIEDFVNNIGSSIVKIFSVGAISYVASTVFRNIAVESQTSKIKEFSPNDFSDKFKIAAKKNTKYSIYVIDDIDRCDPAQTIEILDTIKGYLKEDKGNYQFIIPIDKDRLYKILKLEREYNNFECDEYYSKIFDLSIIIKKPGLLNMFDMIKIESQKINLELSNISISLLADFLIKTPRNVKTHLNNIKSLSETYKKQIVYGLIKESKQKSYLDQIIKVYIIEKNWPVVFDFIQENYRRKNIDNELINNVDEYKKEMPELKYFIDQSVHTSINGILGVYLNLKDDEINMDQELTSAILTNNLNNDLEGINIEKFVYHFEYVFDIYIMKRGLVNTYLHNIMAVYFHGLNYYENIEKIELCKISLANIYSKFNYSISSNVSEAKTQVNKIKKELLAFSESDKCDNKYIKIFERFIEILIVIEDIDIVVDLLCNLNHLFTKVFIREKLLDVLAKDTNSNVSFSQIMKLKCLSSDDVDKILKSATEKNRKDVIYSIITCYPDLISVNEDSIFNKLNICSKLGNSYSNWKANDANFDLIEMKILNMILENGTQNLVSNVNSKSNYTSYMQNVIQYINSQLKSVECYHDIFKEFINFHLLMEKRNGLRDRLSLVTYYLNIKENEEEINYILSLDVDIRQKHELYIIIFSKNNFDKYVNEYCLYLNECQDTSFMECWCRLLTNKTNLNYGFEYITTPSSVGLNYTYFISRLYPKLLLMNIKLSESIYLNSTFEQLSYNDESWNSVKELKSTDLRTNIVIDKISNFNQYLKCIEIINKRSHSSKYLEAMERIIDNVKSVDELLNIHNYLDNDKILNKKDALLIKEKVQKSYPNSKEDFHMIIWSKDGAN